MKVPFLDFKKEADILLDNGLMKDIKEVIRSGHYLFGPKSKLLEEKLSERFNSNAVLVGSGTDALYLSLRACGIKSGMRVAVPAISAIPTAAAVKIIGAHPVYIDVDRETCLIDLTELEIALETQSINAVIAVHLYGNVVDSFKVKELCLKHNIPLVEDCAQAFDCVYTGGSGSCKLVGTVGNASAFSFFPTKTLGSLSDAGLVISNDVQIIQKVKELRFYGQVDKYVMGSESGINSRADEIQCSILLKKLEYLDELNERRSDLLIIYNDSFKNISTVKFMEYIDGFRCNPHLFPLFINNRKVFMRLMAKNDIETMIHYPFTLPSAMANEIKSYPNAEYISNHIVSIPFNVWMSNEEIDYVVEKVLEINYECL